MYQTMIKSGIRAIKGTKFSDDPKENARLRSVAIRQLIGFHAASVLFAGVYGIPLYGAISMAFDAYLDDEEDDFAEHEGAQISNFRVEEKESGQNHLEMISSELSKE